MRTLRDRPAHYVGGQGPSAAALLRAAFFVDSVGFYVFCEYVQYFEGWVDAAGKPDEGTE